MVNILQFEVDFIMIKLEKLVIQLLVLGYGLLVMVLILVIPMVNLGIRLPIQ